MTEKEEIEQLIDDLEIIFHQVRTLGVKVTKYIPDSIYNISYDYFEITIDELKKLKWGVMKIKLRIFSYFFNKYTPESIYLVGQFMDPYDWHLIKFKKKRKIIKWWIVWHSDTPMRPLPSLMSGWNPLNHHTPLYKYRRIEYINISINGG